MSAALERLSHFRFPVHLTETTKLYFARRAALESGQLQADMRGAAGSPPDGAALDRLSKIVETNSLLRTTCVATQIDGGHAENALPQRARATLQCRVIPGETSDQIHDELAAALADPSVSLRVLTPGRPSPESPPSPAVLRAVEEVTHGLWPDVIVLPFMAAGASDSVYTLQAGLPSYASTACSTTSTTGAHTAGMNASASRPSTMSSNSPIV